MSRIYFSINAKTFEDIKKRLNQAAIDEDPNSKENKDLLILEVNFDADDLYLENDKDQIYFNIPEVRAFGQDVGYLSVNLDISQDLAIEVVDRYMKKLGKLKTVLEATK